ncbi:hypothetical protein [Cytobacillus firmus]|uniref:hypothetical protein n=1 Tax=Cytobacillus firmus TaxID=1399 RepID=UPI0018CF6AA3|nr:hypothetical protein [Cytobacillus firmus]MBG9585607.1 hypothetical protein [Cytobacillus firmus]
MDGLLLRAQESGEQLEMIYQNGTGEISQRSVKILEVQSDSVKAYCFLRKMPRVFRKDNILSIGPMRKHRKGA